MHVIATLLSSFRLSGWQHCTTAVLVWLRTNKGREALNPVYTIAMGVRAEVASPSNKTMHSVPFIFNLLARRVLVT
jgi:hypothetical protein